ncbi:hypothetical protein [Bartonella sp. AD13SXNS]
MAFFCVVEACWVHVGGRRVGRSVGRVLDEAVFAVLCWEGTSIWFMKEDAGWGRVVCGFDGGDV